MEASQPEYVFNTVGEHPCEKLLVDKDLKCEQSLDILMNKIKSMPDYNEVFGKHVNECCVKGLDPFNGFTQKAIDHWDLWEEAADYLISFNEKQESK